MGLELTLALVLAVSLAGCRSDRNVEPAAPGEVETVAGGGDKGLHQAPAAEGVRVRDVDLGHVAGVDVGPDRVVYLLLRPEGTRRDRFARIDGDRVRLVPMPEDLSWVDDFAVDRDGSIVAGDILRKRVVRVRDGRAEVLATSIAGEAVDEPLAVDVAPDGTVYVADGQGWVGAIAPDGTTRMVVSGHRRVARPGDLIATADELLVYEWRHAGVLRVDLASGEVRDVVGPSPDSLKGDRGDGGPALRAALEVGRMALGPDGTLYLAQSSTHKIRAVAPDGVIRTVAGSGKDGFSGDGSGALGAKFREPVAVAHDGNGGLLIADYGNNRLRRLVLPR